MIASTRVVKVEPDIPAAIGCADRTRNRHTGVPIVELAGQIGRPQHDGMKHAGQASWAETIQAQRRLTCDA